jgi:hypothetical protein
MQCNAIHGGHAHHAPRHARDMQQATTATATAATTAWNPTIIMSSSPSSTPQQADWEWQDLFL